MSDIKPDQLETLKKINEKYNALGQDAGAFLKGFSYSKPVNYWDYIQLETLLSLQRPRTDYPDEPIFIMYHQVTELLLKLIVHELKQVVDADKKEIEFLKTKIERVNRYASVLTQSFGVMREGMDYDQYNDFRLSLAPASGLQSNQFRVVEIMCTDLHNLVNTRVKGKLPVDANLDQLFDELYWKDAGLDRKTGKKTQTLKQFEDKYIDELKGLATRMKTQNVLCRFLEFSEKEVGYLEFKNALREFDHTYNVVWPLSHLKTAEHYLNFKGEVKPATGGSDWQKYLHPSFQRRIFFPQLWSKEELKNWGKF
jgi:tryptophan 2,3-dioxygenase